MKIKGSFINVIKDAVVITISSFLYAFTFNFFFETNNLAMGGFSGIGQVLHYYFEFLTPGIVVFVLNLPLMVISIKKQGWKSLMATGFAITVTSLMIDAMNAVVDYLGWHYPKMDQPLLASVFGGIICGASLGFMMLKNATTGGTELAARLLKYVFRNISIGKICLVIDVTVVCLYALAYRQINAALYGMIAMYISSIAMDMVVYGAVNAKLAYIISDKSKEISDKIIEMKHGVTFLNGKGAFTGANKNILLCAVRPSSMAKIKSAVVEVDKDAFIIVSDAKEVYGEGFGVYNEHTL